MTGFDSISFATFVLGMAYFFTALYLISQSPPGKKAPRRLPKVAVLVAMRNEEQTIAGCLQSLKNQTYPTHLFDVYVINDRSTDRSVQQANPFIKMNEHFHLIEIREDKNGLKGKMNALAQALDLVKAEYILITDADCIVPPKWIETHMTYYAETVGMVGGLTMLEPTEYTKPPMEYRSGLFGKVQALDWLFLQSIASFACHAGKPISILGNNFGFRKAAYDAVGGFKAIGFSLTEDFALMRALDKQGGWQIRYTLDPEAAIFSYPSRNFRSFFMQRLRWVKGGRKARFFGYLIMGLSVLTHLFVLLSFVFSRWNTPVALGIGMVLGVNYLIIKRALRALNMSRLQKYFFLFQIFHLIYLLIFPALAFLPFRVRWKERRF